MNDPCGLGDESAVREHEAGRAGAQGINPLSKVGWALQCADAGSGKAIKVLAAALRAKEAEAAEFEMALRGLGHSANDLIDSLTGTAAEHRLADLLNRVYESMVEARAVLQKYPESAK